MNTNHKHVDFSNLLLLYRGGLNLKDTNQFMKHLETCEECQNSLDAIKAFDVVELRNTDTQKCEALDKKLFCITKNHVKKSGKNKSMKILQYHFYENRLRYIALAASFLLFFSLKLIPSQYDKMDKIVDNTTNVSPSVSQETMTENTENYITNSGAESKMGLIDNVVDVVANAALHILHKDGSSIDKITVGRVCAFSEKIDQYGHVWQNLPTISDNHYVENFMSCKQTNIIAKDSSITNQNIGEHACASGDDSKTLGNHDFTFGDRNTEASGEGAFALGSNGKNSFAAGNRAIALGANSISLGLETRSVGDQSTAMGNKTEAIGINATSTGLSTVASGAQSTAMGNNTQASGLNATSIGLNTLASGINSTAMGSNTEANNLNSTSIGFNTLASGINSTAMGNGTTASGDNSIAMGKNTHAIGDNTTAMGLNTVAYEVGGSTLGVETESCGKIATAMGYRSRACGYVSTAMGNSSVADDTTSTAMGYFTLSSGRHSTTMGNRSRAYGTNSFAMGYKTIAGVRNYDPVFTGDNNSITGVDTGAVQPLDTINSEHFAENAIAMGNQTEARGINALSTGFKTVAKNTNATAMGNQTVAGGLNSTTMGYKTEATHQDAIAMGNQTSAVAYRAFASGYKTRASGDDATAMGRQTLASGPKSMASGFKSRATGVATTAIGANTLADGAHSMATGDSTRALGNASFTMGIQTQATGSYSVAMGTNSRASGENSLSGGYKSIAIGDNSVAFGTGNEAKKNNSIAIGEDAIADGSAAVAMGREVQALGENSTAFGYQTIASKNEAFAAGRLAEANGDNSVAIGNNAFANGQNSFAIGKNVVNNENNSMKVGFNKAKSDTPALCIKTTGAGFWNSNPQYELDVNGMVRTNSFIIHSDSSLMHDVNKLECSLKKITQLRSVSYRIEIDKTGNSNYRTQNGFIAQELESIFPNLAYTDNEGYMSIDYISLIPIVIDAVKELDQDKEKEEEITSVLMRQNIDLSLEVEKLKKDIEILKNLVNVNDTHQ